MSRYKLRPVAWPFRNIYSSFGERQSTLLPQGPGWSYTSWTRLAPRLSLPCASIANIPTSSNLAIRPASSFPTETVTYHHPCSWPREQTQTKEDQCLWIQRMSPKAGRFHLPKLSIVLQNSAEIPFLLPKSLISSCV